MPIRAVVFDLFDTLVDLSMDGLPVVEVGERRFPTTLGALHAHVIEHKDVSLAELGDEVWEIDKELRAPRAEQGRELPTLERMEALTRRLGIDDPKLPARLTATHMRMLRDQVTPLAHHPEVLTDLKARGLKLAVCSNFSHSQTALRVLEDAGLRWHFDAVIISDAVVWRKPRPEIFHATLACLGAAPEETLHVGDSLKADIGGASPLGIETAWVTRQIPDTEAALAEHAGPEPTHVIGDLGELTTLVD